MRTKNIKLHVRSLGCKANLADAAAVIEGLDPEQVGLVDEPERADLVLLNTCTVTHKADRDVRKFLGSLARKAPGVQVVVTGCQTVSAPEAFSSFANVLAVIRPGEIEDLVRSIAGDCLPPGSGSESPFMRLGRQRAFVKVQDGCSANCAYCIIPAVRGRPRSVSVPQAVSAVKTRLEQGHRELVLSGIHLGRYGRDDGADCDLAELVTRLGEVFADYPQCRLRLSSIEPLEWTGSLIEVIQNSPFVCRHFHVPLQSGDNSILKLMGRPYGAEEYLERLNVLHNRFPDAAIGADVLVGFPGETELTAGNTMRLVQAAPLNYLHVFTYSARPGTRAAQMDQRADPESTRTWAAQLRTLGQSRWLEFLGAGIGQNHPVLVERSGPRGPRGYTQHYRQVCLSEGVAQPGEMVSTLIVELDGDCLLGKAARSMTHERSQEAACQSV